MAEEKKKDHDPHGERRPRGRHERQKPKPKFGVLPVSDYVAAVADPDAQPQAGSVGAVVAALAAAMGSLAVQALRSDDEALRQTAEELRQMTDYMVFQIDEDCARASRMTSAGTTLPPRATTLTSRCVSRATSRTRSCTSCAAASS